MSKELLLQSELNEYFTFIKEEKRLDTTFEIYQDDYGQSFTVAWVEDEKVKQWSCGTYNDYQEELEDIAFCLCMKKVESGEKLSIDTIETLVYCYGIEEIQGEDHRWTRDMKTIIKYHDSYYAIDWQKGLTEYQEDYFFDQPYEVERKEKIVTTYYYERVKRNGN